MTIPIDWPRVVATSVCLALIGAGAMYFSTYAPKPFSAQEQAASKARNLANCGGGMFDVVPHDQHCPRYDAIALDESGGCWPTECEIFTLTLGAEGKAILEVRAPESERGRYEASISSYEFRELSNLIASLELDRRGHLLPQPPDGSSYTLRAGCRNTWTVVANEGGAAGETRAVEQCLLDFRQRADWSLVVPRPAAGTNRVDPD